MSMTVVNFVLPPQGPYLVPITLNKWVLAACCMFFPACALTGVVPVFAD